MAATPPSQPRFNWRQLLTPAWLAGVISVGFHGVLFAAGPTFPSLGFDQLTEETLVAESRNVPLVELTPGEQDRLPDFTSPFYNFDEFSDLEPLAPLFEDGAKLSGSDRVINSEPLLSPGRNASPPSAYNLPFGITRLESRSGSPVPLSGGLPPIGSLGTRGGNNTDGVQLNDDSAQASVSPPGADALRSDADGDSSAVSAEDAEAIAANSNPTDTLTLEERLAAYTFDDTQMTEAAVTSSYGDWLELGETLATELEIGEVAAIRSAFEEAATAGILAPVSDEDETDPDEEVVAEGIVRRPLNLEIEYGAGICLTQEPQNGLVGAWVSPAGELLGEPQVIRSTGYLGLDQQATGYIETLDFSTVETFTGYQFEVLVTYSPDGCVEIGRQPPAAPAAEAEKPAVDEKAPAKEPSSRTGLEVTPTESTQTPPADAAEAEIDATSEEEDEATPATED